MPSGRSAPGNLLNYGDKLDILLRCADHEPVDAG
jgi:hypothetical protein